MSYMSARTVANSSAATTLENSIRASRVRRCSACYFGSIAAAGGLAIAGASMLVAIAPLSLWALLLTFAG